MQQGAPGNTKGELIERKGGIGLRFIIPHISQLNKRARRTVPEERLEAEGRGSHNLTLSTPEATVGVKAAGNVLTIEQIVHMQRHV